MIHDNSFPTPYSGWIIIFTTDDGIALFGINPDLYHFRRLLLPDISTKKKNKFPSKSRKEAVKL